MQKTEHASEDEQAPSAPSDVLELQPTNAIPDTEGAITTAIQAAQPSTAPNNALSKNQLKKLKRKEAWEAGRDHRKVKRKEKAQERKQRKKEAKAEAYEKIARGEAVPQTPKQIRHVQVPITIVLDCGYDDKMLPKEQISLSSQVTRAYSDNSKAPFRTHLAVSSFGGTLKDRYENLLNGQYKNWRGIRFFEEDFAHVAEQSSEWMHGPDGGKTEGALKEKSGPFEGEIASSEQPQGEIIYLSSDSTETLTELKPNSTYIIGGIVDKNRHKGICHKAAEAKGIKTAKLPIGEYMEMTSRYVLATNHVVEILLRWLEFGDWGQAFLAVMPPRKKGMLKNMTGSMDGEEEKQQDEADGDGGCTEANQLQDMQDLQREHDQSSAEAPAESGSSEVAA